MVVDEMLERVRKARQEADSGDYAFRKELVELLKKHHFNALVAVVHLQMFCEDMLCHFNTEDLRMYDEPVEARVHIQHRKKERKHGDPSHNEVLSYATRNESLHVIDTEIEH